MFTKWIIEGIEGYRFGEDKKLYRLPFESHGKHYEAREIKKQHPNRYWINKEWWSVHQLKPKIKIDPEPIEIFKTTDLPF